MTHRFILPFGSMLASIALAAAAGCGSAAVDPGTLRMPASGSLLTTTQIKLVRDWIAAGAKND